MTPVIQYTRLTHADKLPDRFITSQVYRPADPDSQREGVIFSQIEILNPWLPATQIGQTIINTAIREYYRAGDTSELNNFEIALKKVNETLAQITQSGETEWIGRLNGVLILINNQDIHISQTGLTQAYLFRSGKVNHITEGMINTAEPHPLKTFSNIMSGTLDLHDKIIIANPVVFETVPLERIKEIISSAAPALAAEELAKLLRREKKTAGEALVLELTTKDDVASMPPEYKIDTVYIDRKAAFNLGQLKDATMRVGGPLVGSVITGAARALKKADFHFEKHIVPAVTKVSTRAYHLTRKAATSIYSKVRGQKIHHHSENTQLASGNEESQKSKAQLPASAAKIAAPLKNYGSTAGNWLKEKLSFSRDGSANRSRAYGIWGIALLIVLVILIIMSWHPGSRQQPVGNTDGLATDLGEKFNRVKLLSAYNDKPSALKELADIISQIQAVEKDQTLSLSLTELKKQAVSELASLTNSIQLNNITGLTEWGDKQFIATVDSQVMVVDGEKLTLLPATDTALTGVGNAMAISSDKDNKLVYILGGSGMWRFNPKDGSLNQVTLTEASWPAAKQISIFGGNVYALDAAGNKIIKYAPKDSGFAAGAAYSQPEGSELNSAVDIAINGSVMTLFGDSRIVKYTKTGRTPIALTELPAEGFLSSPTRIYADSDSGDIAILHEDLWLKGLYRVSFLTRAGKYKRSVILPLDRGTVLNADLDLKTGLATIVTDKTIYQANTNSG